jgi:hypothetical protein
MTVAPKGINPNGAAHHATVNKPTTVAMLNPKMIVNCGHGVLPNPDGRVQNSMNVSVSRGMLMALQGIARSSS